MDDITPQKPSYKVPKLDQIDTSEPEPKEQEELDPIEPSGVTNAEDINLDIDSTIQSDNNSNDTINNDDKSNEDKPDLTIKPSPDHKKRKKTIIIAIVVLVILIISGLAYWFFVKSNSSKITIKPIISTKKTTPKAKPTSPLTGIELSSASLASRPVTGLMIENSLSARPQSGLTDAGIVFEAVAEGGITRFLALYQEAQPTYIGPVRSARPYFVDFALTFDASFGHVGGSPDAMSDIKTLGVKDIDQFYNSWAYWRISEREAPHNVYTSFEKLDNLNQSKGYTSSKFTSFNRKKDVPQTPTATSIDFSISSYLYNAHYDYDATTNTYKRSEGGTAHTDEKSGKQISPKVVIALVMTKGLMSDGTHTTYQDTGSGPMYLFQDGIVSEGTWSKTDRKGAFTFTDKNGLSIKLNAGQTWVSLVGNASDVSYKQ